MKVTYDKYYQTENLFGEPYPELLDFFSQYPEKGKVLDLGCGQGRDAISLARLGFEVVGIDHSEVGIQQLNQIAQKENLNLVGEVGDIYQVANHEEYDFILLDSMFHFAKKDKKREVELIRTILTEVKSGCFIVVCIVDSGTKVETLKKQFDDKIAVNTISDIKFKYTYEDQDNEHKSEMDYRLMVVEKT